MSALTIVIVSYNAQADLARCLDSLLAAPPAIDHAIVVVDNASADGSRDVVAARPNVRLIALPANVGFAQVLAPDHLCLRVYERGVGETLACGSGACAAVASLVRRGRLAREATVSLPGGDLRIRWPHDGAEVIMAGPAAFVFEGEWQA